MKMPLWSLFVWGNCHVPRNISEWEKKEGWIPGRESGPFGMLGMSLF